VWRNKVNDWKISNSRLFRCDHCQYAFLTKENTNITRCPRCNGMCILRKKRKY
jgi:rubrerythrin